MVVGRAPGKPPLSLLLVLRSVALIRWPPRSRWSGSVPSARVCRVAVLVTVVVVAGGGWRCVLRHGFSGDGESSGTGMQHTNIGVNNWVMMGYLTYHLSRFARNRNIFL